MLVFFSQFQQKISFRYFHLPATKCQNPIKFQNAMANTECMPEFSDNKQLLMSDAANIPPSELFPVNFSLYRLRKCSYSFSFPGAQLT